nr:GNAT family N-acetyltransferase [candidate division Zixibacteria bacterium]
MFIIETMTADDIPFAVGLTDFEKWGYLPSDFERLIDLSPEGCFVAVSDDHPSGIITTISYGDYGFMGTLIVSASERGKGIGEKLLRRAIEYLQNKGVKSIELDGVFAAVSLYRRYGFQDKYLSIRMSRKPGIGKAVLGSCPPDLLGQIIAFDREKTGLNRRKLLVRYFEETPDMIYAVRKRRVTAYAIVRTRANNCLSVGPVVAEKMADAETLLAALINKFGSQAISIGIPDIMHKIPEFLAGQGFVYNAPSLRMYLGERRDYENHVFGIFGPEKG